MAVASQNLWWGLKAHEWLGVTAGFVTLISFVITILAWRNARGAREAAQEAAGIVRTHRDAAELAILMAHQRSVLYGLTEAVTQDSKESAMRYLGLWADGSQPILGLVQDEALAEAIRAARYQARSTGRLLRRRAKSAMPWDTDVAVEAIEHAMDLLGEYSHDLIRVDAHLDGKTKEVNVG